MGFLDKKTIGMEISYDGIAGAIVARGAGNAMVTQASRRAFPHIMLQRSIKEPQVLQPETFVQALRETWEALQPHTNNIALSLPDSAGHVSLMSLDEPWQTYDEAIEILSWKAAKRLAIDPAFLHLDFQLIERCHNGSTHLLIALAYRSVISQYEELTQKAGLQPVHLSFNSLNLLNLFDAKTTEANLITFLYDNVLSTMAMQNAKPFFLRIKQLPTTDSETQLERELNASLSAVQRLINNEDIGACYYLLPHETPLIMDFLSATFNLPPNIVPLESVVQRSAELGISSKQLMQSAAALGAALGGY